MDRVGRNENVSVPDIDVDYHEIVNMIEVVTDLNRRELACSTTDDEVSSCAACNLARNVLRNVKLSVGPTNFELYVVSPFSRESYVRH